MNSQPNTPNAQSKKESFVDKIIGYLNFYRVHLLFLCVGVHYHQGPFKLTAFNYSTVTPVVFSGIFYASNGKYKISYIDSLFNCVSAMMVCGLATINLSQLTGFQQALLFIQMCIGNPVRPFLAGANAEGDAHSWSH